MPALAPGPLSGSSPSLPPLSHSLTPPRSCVHLQMPSRLTSLAPSQPPAAGGPVMQGGGVGAALLCPTGLPLGPGGAQSPSPPQARGENAGWEPPGSELGRERGAWSGSHFSPSPASPPCARRTASSGGAGGASEGGMGPGSRGTNPEPVAGTGRGLRGDPEPAAGTVRLSGELAQATTCSPLPAPRVCPLPPSCNPPTPARA